MEDDVIESDDIEAIRDACRMLPELRDERRRARAKTDALLEDLERLEDDVIDAGLGDEDDIIEPLVDIRHRATKNRAALEDLEATIEILEHICPEGKHQ